MRWPLGGAPRPFTPPHTPHPPPTHPPPSRPMELREKGRREAGGWNELEKRRCDFIVERWPCLGRAQPAYVGFYRVFTEFSLFFWSFLSLSLSLFSSCSILFFLSFFLFCRKKSRRLPVGSRLSDIKKKEKKIQLQSIWRRAQLVRLVLNRISPRVDFFFGRNPNRWKSMDREELISLR